MKYRYRIRIFDPTTKEALFDAILNSIGEAQDYLSRHLFYGCEWWMESIA